MFKSLSPLISIALAISIFVFFAKPMFAEIAEIQNETEEYRQAVDKASQFNALLQEKISIINSFSLLEMERLEAIVPNDIDEVRILVDLKAMAEANGMLFGNVAVGELVSDIYADTAANTPSQNVSVNDFSSVEITFDVIGTYEQLRTMLADIERSLTLMEITKLGFEVTESDLEQYSLTIRTRALMSSGE